MNEQRAGLCYSYCGKLLLFAVPPMLIGLVALLFAAGTSAIVASIPLQIGLFALIVLVAVFLLENKETGKK